MANIDEDSIERLLSELEAAAGADDEQGSGDVFVTPARHHPGVSHHSAPSPPQQPLGAAATPPRSLADFATYTADAYEASVDLLDEGDATRKRRVPIPHKLEPLHLASEGGGVALPKLETATGTLPSLEVLTGIPSAPGASGRSPGCAARNANAGSGAAEIAVEREEWAPTELQGSEARGSETAGALPPMHINVLPLVHLRPLATSGIAPRPRWGHTLTPVGDSLFMFGGAVDEACGPDASLPSTTVASADFFELDTTACTWEPAFAASGAPPAPRVQHTACCYRGESVLIVGGSPLTGVGSALYNDVHLYDVLTQQWHALAPPQTQTHRGSVPAGRYGHSAVMCSDSVVALFGGRCNRRSRDAGKSPYVLSNDVFFFHVALRRWTRAGKRHGDEDEGGGGAGLGGPEHDEEAGATATAPRKRFNHASCVAGGLLFVHGGQTNDATLSDTWAFNIALGTWTLVHDGSNTIPRSMHFAFFSGGLLVVVGGVSASSSGDAQGAGHGLIAALPVAAPDEMSRRWAGIKASSAVAVHPTQHQFGAAMHQGFVFLLGGVSGGEKPSAQVIRFLALDGLPPDDPHAHSAAAIMRRLRTSALVPDVFLDVSGTRVGAHKFVLSLRAPRLWSEIAACRGDGDPKAPTYSLTGNSRVRGLSVPISLRQLHLLLDYLYCGALPGGDAGGGGVLGGSVGGEDGLMEGEEEDGAASARSLLADVAVAFSITHLVEALEHASTSPSRRRAVRTSASIQSRRAQEAQQQCEAQLARDLDQLLESGKDATAQVLFRDPHTDAVMSAPVHPAVLMHSSDVFRRLLKPLLCDGVPATEYLGITAKVASASRSSSKRGLTVGSVQIPLLAVRHVLRYLYTGAVQLPPEAYLPVMCAAQTMRLPRLRAICECLIAREEVDERTCCDFLTVARHHGAQHLYELSLLTAAAAFGETSESPHFLSLLAEEKTEIRKAAMAMTGRAVGAAAAAAATAAAAADSAPGVVQKAPIHYARAFAASH